MHVLQELVYATIVEFTTTKKHIVIVYTHTSGKRAIHKLSPDKHPMRNCYNDLIIGQRYIIVTENVRAHRWVWRKALAVTSKEMDAFRSIAGLTPTDIQMQDAMSGLRQSRAHETPAVPDNLVTF